MFKKFDLKKGGAFISSADDRLKTFDEVLIVVDTYGIGQIFAYWIYTKSGTCHCKLVIRGLARVTAKAGGGGYDKRAASLEKALDKVGIVTGREVDHRESVLRAVAEELGHTVKSVISA